jgi:hypothetical protein
MQFVLTLPHKAGHLLSPFALLAFVQKNQLKHTKKKNRHCFFSRHRQTKRIRDILTRSPATILALGAT